MKYNVFILCVFLLLSCVKINAQSPETTPTADSSLIYNQDSVQQQTSISHPNVFENDFQNKDSTNGQDTIVKTGLNLMTKIEENTHVDFTKDGWTLFAILTFIISSIISLFTFYAQQKTEKHTKNVSIKAQIGQLHDLPRHFYRNLVCTIAILLKYRHPSNKRLTLFNSYPSEANMEKLQTLPEEFFLNIDEANDEIFMIMHEQKLLFKNYNIEVAVASKHFSRKDITEESIINDIDNIQFKPLYLIRRNFELHNALEIYNNRSWLEKNFPKAYKYLKPEQQTNDKPLNFNKYLVDVIYYFVKEHFEKLKFNTLNSDEQLNMYKDILTDTNFKEHLTCGGKNGIDRSFDFLFKKPSNEVATYEFLNWLDEKLYINSQKFLIYFFNRYQNEVYTKKISEHHLSIIFSHIDSNSLCEYYNINPIYTEVVKSYFEFWINEHWEIKSLIYNMLKIDAVLEMPIIGMIKL